LSQAVGKIVATASDNPGFARIQSTLQLDKPELNIDLIVILAQDLGVSMDSIADALNISLALQV